jgi:hypothetical protein
MAFEVHGKTSSGVSIKPFRAGNISGSFACRTRNIAEFTGPDFKSKMIRRHDA